MFCRKTQFRSTPSHLDPKSGGPRSIVTPIAGAALLLGGVMLLNSAFALGPEFRTSVVAEAQPLTLASSGQLSFADECSGRADCPMGMNCRSYPVGGRGARCVADAAEGESCGVQLPCSPALACDESSRQETVAPVCRRTCDVSADCHSGECCDGSFLCRALSQCSAAEAAQSQAATRIGPSAYAPAALVR